MNPRILYWVKQAQLLFFSWIIFLIPSNMFLKLLSDGAYVSGTLVDYLILKLYLTDIFIIVVICLWCIELGWRSIFRTVRKYIKLLISVLCVAVIHLVTQINLANPFTTLGNVYAPSQVWFVAKMFLFWIFLAWMLEKKSLTLRRIIFTSLSCLIVFQSVLAGYQYLTQRPIFGYWFFGEPMFSLDPTVAKSAHPGALAILPYGTTAHPNVLAGVSVLSALYVMYLAGLEKNKSKEIWAGMLVVLAGGVAFTAESGTALIALVMGVISYWSLRITSAPAQRFIKTSLGVCSALVVIGLPLWIGLSHATVPSIHRRNELERVSINMIVSHPIFGVGLNRFTTVMQQHGTVSGTIRFLQPVHNLPLLWVSETGLLGVAFFLLILYFVHKKYSLNFLAYCAVGLPILPIISLDHYVLSVQSGMLIATIILAEVLEKKVDLY